MPRREDEGESTERWEGRRRKSRGRGACVTRTAAILALLIVCFGAGFTARPSQAAAPAAFRLPFVGHAFFYSYPGHGVDQRDIKPKGPDAWDGTVLAAADGIVVDTDPYDPSAFCPAGTPINGEQQRIMIEHSLGGATYRTSYEHLSSIYVDEGDKVVAGEAIGFYGMTGCASGLHLHFDVRQGSNSVNIDDLPGVNSLVICDLDANTPLPACPAGDALGPAPTSAGSVDVALIIDSSGSMAGNDPGNKRIDAAKAYLTGLSFLPSDRVAVVDFATTARLARGLSPVPAEKQQLVDAINTIGSNGFSTNIRAGIDAACAELKAHGSAAKRGAILLTDGLHNEGPFGNPQQCFKDNGWPIFTFGFGSADDAFLTNIATDTGGEFQHAPTSDFVCVFTRVRGLIANTTPGPCTARNVQPNQTTQFAVNVPASQAQATFSSSWTGSDIAMSLVSPSGRTIDRGTSASDVVHDLGATFESYGIANPEVGDWQVKLFGLDVPPEGEDAVFNLVSIPKPPEAATETPTSTPTGASTPRPVRTHTPVPATAAPPSATPAVQATVASPQSTPTFVRGVAGVIRMPETGTGSLRSDTPESAIIAALGTLGTLGTLGALGVAVMGAGRSARRNRGG